MKSGTTHWRNIFISILTLLAFTLAGCVTRVVHKPPKTKKVIVVRDVKPHVPQPIELEPKEP